MTLTFALVERGDGSVNVRRSLAAEWAPPRALDIAPTMTTVHDPMSFVTYGRFSRMGHQRQGGPACTLIAAQRCEDQHAATSAQASQPVAIGVVCASAIRQSPRSSRTET